MNRKNIKRNELGITVISLIIIVLLIVIFIGIAIVIVNNNKKPSYINEEIINNQIYNNEVTFDNIDSNNNEKIILYNSFEEYLKTFDLSLDNVILNSTSSYNPDEKPYSYYVRYEGYWFDSISGDNSTYTVYEDSEGHIIKNSFNEDPDKFPTLEELKNKYDNLSSEELKENLNGRFTHDRFDCYNYMSSLDELQKYLERCSFTQDEINDEINRLENSYDEYVESEKEYKPEKKYTKKELIKVFNNLV